MGLLSFLKKPRYSLEDLDVPPTPPMELDFHTLNTPMPSSMPDISGLDFGMRDTQAQGVHRDAQDSGLQEPIQTKPIQTMQQSMQGSMQKTTQENPKEPMAYSFPELPSAPSSIFMTDAADTTGATGYDSDFDFPPPPSFTTEFTTEKSPANPLFDNPMFELKPMPQAEVHFEKMKAQNAETETPEIEKAGSIASSIQSAQTTAQSIESWTAPLTAPQIHPQLKLKADEEIDFSKPLFVPADKYRYVLDTLPSLKTHISTIDLGIIKTVEMESNKEAKFNKWQNSLEDIQRKIVFIDKTLFK